MLKLFIAFVLILMCYPAWPDTKKGLDDIFHVGIILEHTCSSVTRPIKELKGFHKANLKVDEQFYIAFKITASNLKFFDANMKFVAEPGEFKFFVGGNSIDLLEADFESIK